MGESEQVFPLATIRCLRTLCEKQSAQYLNKVVTFMKGICQAGLSLNKDKKDICSHAIFFSVSLVHVNMHKHTVCS